MGGGAVPVAVGRVEVKLTQAFEMGEGIVGKLLTDRGAGLFAQAFY
jgi:hypothetical protein